jgi:hypothetical protein
MRRISYVFLLMLLSSTAHAGGYSFSAGGHFIHVEAARHCRSLSCISWSDSQGRRSHRDDDETATPAPAKPVATAPACQPAPAAVAPETAAPRAVPAPVTLPPTPAPAPVRAQVAPAPVAPAPLVQPAPVPVPVKLAPVRAQVPSTMELAAANAPAVPKAEIVIGKPKEKVTVEATVADKSVEQPDWAREWSPPKDAPAPRPTKVVAHADDSPIGDWQTEGRKGLVRIEKCGVALCGYVLNEATNATGETVLSNMKPKTGTQWSGDIYSRASGNTYYGRISFRQPNTLRVEACAVGRFFCSGNNWSRVAKPDELVTSRDLRPSPKS